MVLSKKAGEGEGGESDFACPAEPTPIKRRTIASTEEEARNGESGTEGKKQGGKKSVNGAYSSTESPLENGSKLVARDRGLTQGEEDGGDAKSRR